MENTGFKQTKKVGVAGSFINQMYGNNATMPKVGEYCTFLYYTDRKVGIVREVSIDGKTCKIESCNTVWDQNLPGGEGHQNWKHDPSGNIGTYTYRKNAWFSVGRRVEFTKEFLSTIPDPCVGIYLRKNNPELLEKVYAGHVMPYNVVEGVTKEHKVYNKVSVIFGVCDYYYDWSF